MFSELKGTLKTWEEHLSCSSSYSCSLFPFLLRISQEAATSVWFCHHWPCSEGLLCNHTGVKWRLFGNDGWGENASPAGVIQRASERNVTVPEVEKVLWDCGKDAILSWSNIVKNMFSIECLHFTLVIKKKKNPCLTHYNFLNIKVLVNVKQAK